MLRRTLAKMSTTKPSQEVRTEAGFRSKRQDTHKDKMDEESVQYIIDGPLRRVAPYYFTYLTYCKMRWRDRTLIDIFANEFRDREEAYYRKAIESGTVLLNGKAAGIDTFVRNGDLITHKIHRHEPSVTSRPIKIVEETDELLIIDKPAGIPVHPTGRYRFNTVTKILKLEMGIEAHPCNRLDRLTSGLMFLAKNPKGADKFVEQLKAREVKKEYIAKVKGNFPNETITVDKPLLTLEPRLGLNKIDEEEGKEAKTIFKKISSDGETSIVKCMPQTGRTHQIRVHLQFLGFPIANDPIYSNEKVWGPKLGKGNEADYNSVMERLDKVGKTESASSWYHPNSHGEVLLGERCAVCETDLYSDPGPNDLDLWLHAYRYYSTDPENPWSHQTSFPDWALDQHKSFMEKALKQAQQCPPTTTAFGVGAVLVHDGKILETGFSRELPGNTHAEQCALQKYFEKTGQEDVPEGTVIYTTMEPCSFRLSGNLPCVERILKTKIRACFVGVVEPDTFVKDNTGLQKLREKDVEYIKIDGYEDEILKAAFKGHPEHERKQAELEQHKNFMRLALEQAQQCPPTTTAFGVGALLVKDGEILETGFSRELPGNTHAEQCALHKYFEKTGEKDVPEGTVIYTTMEPCSFRLSGNLPCVDRILQTGIKKCYVGVVEPDTFVKENVGLQKLKEKNVEYIKIDGYEDEILKAAFKGHPGHE